MSNKSRDKHEKMIDVYDTLKLPEKSVKIP